MKLTLSRLAIIIALIAYTGCSSSSGDGDSEEISQNACGVIGRVGERIIEGTQCSRGASPVVMLDFGNGNCTGTMISSQHVLTAAHCFLSPVFSIRVRLGADQPLLARGTRFAIHPDFSIDDDSQLLAYDVAIVELDRNLSLPTLPLLISDSVDSGDAISIFGYGQSANVPASQGGSTGGVLRSGQMRLSEITETHLFADFDDEGSNTCFGDSGGPATATVELLDGNIVTGIVGLTSAGISETCSRGDKSNFANVQNQSVIDFVIELAPATALR